MDMMEQEYKIIDRIKNNYLMFLSVAMIVILIIIATILVNIYGGFNKGDENVKDAVSQSDVLIKSEDERLNSFIKKYFNDRMNLNYEEIFKAFNKQITFDRTNKKEREILVNIKNENKYIKSYDNINVWYVSGRRENEKVVIITYDISFGFSNGIIPSILIAYVVEDDEIYFLDDYDIGTSKYISSVLELMDVKMLYEKVREELERALTGNDELKLVYNSYREYDKSLNDNIDDMFLKDIYESNIENKLNSIDVDESYELPKPKITNVDIATVSIATAVFATRE